MNQIYLAIPLCWPYQLTGAFSKVLPLTQYPEICKEVLNGYSLKEISRAYKITPSSLASCFLLGLKCIIETKFRKGSMKSYSLRILSQPPKIFWLRNWADRNFLNFNKSKCKDLHLGWNNATMQAGADCLGSRSAEKDPGVLVNSRLNMRHQCALAAKANSIVGSISKSVSTMHRAASPPLCSALVKPLLEYGPVLGFPLLERHGHSRTCPTEGHQAAQGLQHMPLE